MRWKRTCKAFSGCSPQRAKNQIRKNRNQPAVQGPKKHAASMSQQKKLSFKVVVLGAVSVGKTSLSIQYVDKQFVQAKATIAGKGSVSQGKSLILVAHGKWARRFPFSHSFAFSFSPRKLPSTPRVSTSRVSVSICRYGWMPPLGYQEVSC
jgi:GTPase SAR1 family protein